MKHKKLYEHADGRHSLHSYPMQQRPFACDIVVLSKYVGYIDIVGTVYHLVIYMQSNKLHSVV